MAARFWVGGTGTWDSTATTHWSASSGGASGASAPVAADTVTFDGSSGGGTVTVDATVSGLSLGSITCGAFTGTIDFSAISALTVTGSFNISGTGTRTLTMGTATYTLTATNANNWDATTTTNLTLSAASATFLLSSPGNFNSQNFVGGGKTYGTLSIGSRTNNSLVLLQSSDTYSNVLIAAPAKVAWSSGITSTISNAITWAGTSSNPIYISAGQAGATIAVAGGSTISWAAINGLTFTGSPTCTNSFDLKSNSGITISAPTTGGARVIGG